MRSFKKTAAIISMAFVLLANSMVSYAAAPEINFEEPEVVAPDAEQYTSISSNAASETIDISDILNLRAQASLGNNPRTAVTNTLTANNQQDFLLFSVTSSKYMYARLDSNNSKYEAVICFADFSTGTLTPTNVSQTANNGFSLNGLPAGDYAVWIHSTDNTYDSSYNFYINSTNPSGTVSTVKRATSDLQYIALQYSDGSIYSNGNYVFNTSIIGTTVQGQFDWERTHDFQTGSDYAYRKMKVSNVVPWMIMGPTYYRSNYASSDDVMLIICDVGTTWQYTESRPFTMTDVFGRKTPRQLDAADVYGGLSDRFHILAYDTAKGEVIDFFSPLNYYYFMGAEPWPQNGITNGLIPLTD